ncbi:unnamed protein product, partial [Symbiodinium microadriaticum]
FTQGLEEHSRLLIKYLVKTVLNPPKEIPFSDIHAFVSVFEELLKIPGLVPDTGRAICAIARRNMLDKSPISLSLSLQQQAVFFRSCFYQGFLKHRAGERLKNAMTDVSAAFSDRLVVVTDIAADGHLTELQLRDLDFAKTIFGASSEE